MIRQLSEQIEQVKRELGISNAQKEITAHSLLISANDAVTPLMRRKKRLAEMSPEIQSDNEGEKEEKESVESKEPKVLMHRLGSKNTRKLWYTKPLYYIQCLVSDHLAQVSDFRVQLLAVPWEFSEGGLECFLYLFVDNSWKILVDDAFFILLLVFPLAALYRAVTVEELQCLGDPLGVDACNCWKNVESGDP